MTRDVFFRQDAIRLAAYNHIARHAPGMHTTPGILEGMVDAFCAGYQDRPDLWKMPFEDYVAEMLAAIK